MYYLDQPRTVSEIADRSDNYRNTVNRVLKRFRDRGPVGTTDGHYEFNADFDRLHEFARELAHYLHRQRFEAVAPKGTILWGGLRRIPRPGRDGDRRGGVPRNRPRSIRGLRPLVPTHRYRYYSYSEELDAVSPAKLCCHTLLIDDGSRHRSYCLLLLSHVDVGEADLREQAAKYVLEDEIDALLRYLETHGEVDDDRLPEWDEFQDLTADYEGDYSETEHRRQPCRLPASVWIGGIRCCIESIDILDSVKIVVKRIQVAEPLGLHIRHHACIDEGEGFVLAKEGLPGREASVVSESMWKRGFSSIRSRRSTAAS